jgi:Flp pilus assembly protein TadD
VRAREQFKVTLGRGHHRTSDVAVAIGRHHANKADYADAVEMFDRAVEVYHDREVYAPEEARVLFYRSKALRQLGKNDQADQDEADCLELYQHLVPTDLRSITELTDADFNRHIVLWAR